MKLWVSLVALMINSLMLYAQVSADFTVSTTFCRNQSLDIVNTSSNANTYEWDFCPADANVLTLDQNLVAVTGLQVGSGYKLIEDNGTWYGFLVSQNNHSLFRLDFGSSPLNSPTVTALGNPGGLLDFPTNIDIFKHNGNWYGVVGLFNPNAGLVRLNFGTSPSGSPTAQALGMFGQVGRYWDVKALIENGNLALVMPLRNGVSSVVVVNYRNSFDNTINTTTDVYASAPITNLGIATGIDVIRSGSDWIALVAANSNNTVVQLRFSSTIFSTPSEERTYGTNLNRPLNVRILKEGSRHVAIIANENTNLKVVDFFDFALANAPSEISHSTLSSLLGIAAVRFKGKSIIQGGGSVNNQVREMVFQSTCNASVDYSEVNTPSNVVYQIGGANDIELRAFDSNRNVSTKGVAVTVSAFVSPAISFQSNGNVCVNSPVVFTSQSPDIISTYSWTFGDAGSSSQQNPTHNYAGAGSYVAKLIVTAANGCTNSAQSNIAIYNQPSSAFTLPVASPICTNQSYAFINTTSFDIGSNPTWEWRVNGALVSTSKDLSYAIPTATAQTIKLKAIIPGCSNESTQSMPTVLQGPTVDFTVADGCQNVAIPFTNTSSGPITGFSWNFGDGNLSMQTNPSNTFSSIGNYNVVLTASNALGCQNSKTRVVAVRSTPQPNFSIDLPPFSCAGSPSQFNDQTASMSDSNISSWAWSFGDAANGSASAKNPAYTYSSAGNYNVKLDVVTNFGCANSIQKSVTISPSPQANFVRSAACLNQDITLSNTSSGSIKNYLWKINGVNYTTINAPNQRFSSPGTYPASLTVTANNNCTNQISKDIIIPVPPAMDFTVEAPCVTNTSVFLNAATGGSDALGSIQWVIDGSSATGLQAQHKFNQDGVYSVAMTYLGQSGCTYSLSRNITVSKGPQATFVVEDETGVAPLEVQFNNQSQSADAYLWKFNDQSQSTSSDKNPTFVFVQNGTYEVELTALNNQGCTDKETKEIKVVIPVIDAVMSDFSLTQDLTDGTQKASVTILNNSNISLTNPEILFDFSGGALLKQKFNVKLKPGESYTSVLGLTIVSRSLEYACAEVLTLGDAKNFDNKKCLTPGKRVFFYPYPNPVADVLNFDWIADVSGSGRASLYSATGNLVFTQEFTTLNKGLNRLTVDVSDLNSGLYILRFTDGKEEKAFRFSIVKK